MLPFDPADGRLGAPLLVTQDYLPELAISGGGVLAVPDRNWLAPGLCLFAGESVAAPARPLGCARLSLPPASVETLDR